MEARRGRKHGTGNLEVDGKQQLGAESQVRWRGELEVLSLGKMACAHTLHRHAEAHVQVVSGLQIRHFQVTYGTSLYSIDIKQICKLISIKS